MADFHVLLVEDDEVDRIAVQRAFRGTDVRVEAVDSGGAAVRRLEDAAGIDLVLLDLSLPDMTGLDVLRQVGRLSIPTVVWTTSTRQGDVNRCYAQGAQGFLPKPQDPARLKDDLDAVVRCWRTMRFRKP